MALVVRETVVDGVAGWDCAHANAAVNRVMARDSFFTRVLNLGEIERFLIFYMVLDSEGNENGREGWDFGNCGRESRSSFRSEEKPHFWQNRPEVGHPIPLQQRVLRLRGSSFVAPAPLRMTVVKKTSAAG